MIFHSLSWNNIITFKIIYPYRNLSMWIKKLELPPQLLKQHDFGDKIQQLNQKVFLHIEYFKQLIEKLHKIYGSSSDQIVKLAIGYQRKALDCTGQSQKCVLGFFRTIKEIYLKFKEQVNKNIIFMKTKKNDATKSINEVIERKIREATLKVRDLKNAIEEYNQIADKYQKKADYFKEIEKDPIKFYSIKKNNDKYLKLNELQFILQGKMDEIHEIKSEIKNLFLQLTMKVKYFFDSIKGKVDEIRKIIFWLRKQINPLKNLKSIQKIDQVSQSAEYSESVVSKIDLQMSFLNEKKVNQKMNQRLDIQIKRNKKQTANQFQNHKRIQQILIEFLVNYVRQVKNTQKQIRQIYQDKECTRFNENKILVTQFLTPKTIDNIEKSVSETNTLFEIMDRIMILASPQIFEQILKYRKQIFTRYENQVDEILDLTENYEEEELKLKHYKVQKKYQDTHKQSKFRFCQKVSIVEKNIKNLFIYDAPTEKKRGNNSEQQLFSNIYYEVLKLPYFIASDPVQKIQRDSFLIRYEKTLKFNKFLDAQYQLESEMNNNDVKKKFLIKTSCCGLIKSKQEIGQKKKIDTFSCALKDGFMLFQGKIQLFQQYLRFKSSFNPHKFFSNTDIYIPKRDILQIIKGKHIMSLLIIIVTRYGQIQFTSFFSDPHELLIELFCNKTYNNDLQHLDEDTEFDGLEKCFEKSFLADAQQNNIYVDSCKIEKNNKTLIINYTYHQRKKVDMLNFQITIKYFENALEYVFSHSERQKSIQIKKKLEAIAKNIIHRDRQKKVQDQMLMKEYQLPTSKKRQMSFDLKNMSQINKVPISFDHSIAQDIQAMEKKSSFSDDVIFNIDSHPSEKGSNPKTDPELQYFSADMSNREESSTYSISKKSLQSNISHSAQTVKNRKKLEKRGKSPEILAAQLQNIGLKKLIIIFLFGGLLLNILLKML